MAGRRKIPLIPLLAALLLLAGVDFALIPCGHTPEKPWAALAQAPVGGHQLMAQVGTAQSALLGPSPTRTHQAASPAFWRSAHRAGHPHGVALCGLEDCSGQAQPSLALASPEPAPPAFSQPILTAPSRRQPPAMAASSRHPATQPPPYQLACAYLI